MDIGIMDQEQAAEKFVDLLVGFLMMLMILISEHLTIAHMMLTKPDLAEIVCKQPKLVDWVLLKLKIDDTCDYRKQYAVGFLTILLVPTTSFELGELGVVEVVVDSLLPYTSLAEDECLLLEEQYLLDRLFECLSYLLLDLNNIVLFAKAGGVDSMIQIIKQVELNYMYYGSAVVALVLALKNCPTAYAKFVDASGLDIAFSASI